VTANFPCNVWSHNSTRPSVHQSDTKMRTRKTVKRPPQHILTWEYYQRVPLILSISQLHNLWYQLAVFTNTSSHQILFPAEVPPRFNYHSKLLPIEKRSLELTNHRRLPLSLRSSACKIDELRMIIRASALPDLM
jgi:hypothetical protein